MLDILRLDVGIGVGVGRVGDMGDSWRAVVVAAVVEGGLGMGWARHVASVDGGVKELGEVPVTLLSSVWLLSTGRG